MTIARMLLALMLVGAPGLASLAEELPELNWDELAPEMEPVDNPFEDMDQAQIDKLRDLLWIRQTAPEEVTDDDRKREQELAKELADEGVDADYMLEQRDIIMEKYRVAATATRPEILGKKVRLPGYLLPLDVEDGAITEFLLVPTIGACIHTPPPPPNQMVYVRYEQGFANASLYTPVWISGELRQDERKETVRFLDGSSNIEVTYAMDADTVQIY
jgi:hypothetical protein